MKTGNTYGYRAILRLPPIGLLTKQGFEAGDLVTSLQADLALAGLLVTQYKVTGKTPNYGLAMEIQPTRSFHSNQSIKQLVDASIVQQTGNKPLWSQDPCCCVVTCCKTQQTLALVSPQGTNPVLAQGQTVNYVSQTAGIGVGDVVKQVEDSASSAVCKIKSNLPSFGSVAVWLFLGLLAIVFVYAYAAHR